MKAYAENNSTLSLLATLAGGTVRELGWAIGRVRQRLSVRFRVMHDRRIDGIDSSRRAAATIGQTIKAGPQLSWLQAP